MLQNNGGANLTVSASGAFTFGTPLATGAAYAVTVLTPPASPVQTCSVTNGTGTVAAANVTNVTVTCTTPAVTRTVGGTVTGLATGASLVLQNNAGSNLTVSANSAFTFAAPVAVGSTYAVTVLTQPATPAQTCVVTAGSGTIAATNVTNVAVNCTNVVTTYTIGGTVAGLATGGTVVLQNNAGNNLTVSANGSFSFTTALNTGVTYAVTVLTQPTVPGPGQSCVVTNGSGTVATANVTSVTLTCTNTDLTAPTLTARTPLAGVLGTAIQGGVVTATFSEPINPSTISSSSFVVQGPSGPVAGNFSYASSNAQVIFTPSSPARLAFDESYSVTLTTAIRDPSNNALAAGQTWSFNTGKKLAIGFEHTCARLVNGKVNCWGRNNEGQLGYGDTNNRGNGVGAATSTLVGVNLGTGRTAVALTAGDYHTCAILDNGDTKCWGLNASGELGQGNTTDVTSPAALPPIDFGGGRKAIEIVGGQSFTCARLDDNSLKCWGLNSSGQLGQGNTTSLGVAAGDIAAASPIALGTGLTAYALALGHYHVCATGKDSGGANHVQCWGDNRWGQLGRGDTNNIGDGPSEMGSALPDVDFGTSLTATYVQATGGHNCAKLSDASIKCWGLNTWGAVGLLVGNGSPGNQLVCSGDVRDCVGDTAGEMGNALTAAVPATTALRLTLGYRHSCAVITGGPLKCWGSNEQGQIGLGNNTGNNVLIGDQAGEMLPGNLVATALKPGKALEEVTGGGFHTCVANTDDSINCWGDNSEGQLGHGDTLTWGDGAGEMGASLPDTNPGT